MGKKHKDKDIVAILPGDLFATMSPSFISRMISAVQRFWASDNKSGESHAGIICSKSGNTFESLKRIQYGHLSKYYGKRVIIARNLYMSNDKYIQGMQAVEHLDGVIYPYWRIALHLIPPLAKKLHVIDIPVCSELVAWFLYGCGLRHKYYMGTNVDTIVDEWRNYDAYEVLFDGVLTERSIQI